MNFIPLMYTHAEIHRYTYYLPHDSILPARAWIMNPRGDEKKGQEDEKKYISPKKWNKKENKERKDYQKWKGTRKYRIRVFFFFHRGVEME